MPRYITRFDGPDGLETMADHDTTEQARDAAIMLLGRHLQSHPRFAYEQHWRIDVLDGAERLLFHVIVATVQAPRPISRASYDEPAPVTP